MATTLKIPISTFLSAMNAKIDSRGQRSFATVAAALSGLAPSQRVEGLPVWIASERRLYRFVGGTHNSNFVPDVSGFPWKRL